MSTPIEIFSLKFYRKTAKTDALKTGAYSQAYMEMNRNIDCRLFSGLEGPKVLPADGYYCSSVVNDCAKVPLSLGAPFQVFPEGFAYPMTEKSNAAADFLVQFPEMNKLCRPASK